MLIKGWLKAEWGMTEQSPGSVLPLTAAGRNQLEAESSAFNNLIQAIQMVMRR